MTVETWKTIPRFGGHYSASNLGNIRRDTSGNGTFIGRVLAQKLGARGYYMVAPSVIGVKQRSFVVHRLVLEAFAGDPVGDRKYANHINGIKTDNRIINLREATNAQNHCNRGPQKNNTSGVKGVYWFKPNRQWKAQIVVNGQSIVLGYFTDFDAAVRCRKDAESKYQGDWKHEGPPTIGYGP